MAKRTHTNELILKFRDELSDKLNRTIKNIEKGSFVSKQLINDLNRTGSSLRGFGMSIFVPTATAITMSTKAAIDFERSFAKVQRIANTTLKPMSALKKEMTAISMTYGQNISSVADTFYNIISARGGTAEATLMAKEYADIAAQMGLAGGGEISTAVNGLTTVMANYESLGYTAKQVGDIMAQTQVVGKTTIDYLSQYLGEVLPFAKNAGLSFEDLSAAMATLTSNGLDTAMATVTLKNALSSILNPSSLAQKSFKQLNVAFGSEALKGGLGEYLNKLKLSLGLSKQAQEQMQKLALSEETTDEELTNFYKKQGVNVDLLLKLFKNIRGATAMLSLTSDIDKYERYRNTMNPENSTGLLQKQANIMMNSTSFQIGQLGAKFNASLARLGNSNLPIVKSLIGKANGLLDKFQNMSDNELNEIAKSLIEVAKWSGSIVLIGTGLQWVGKTLQGANAILRTIYVPLKSLGSAIMAFSKNPLLGVGTVIAGVDIGNVITEKMNEKTNRNPLTMNDDSFTRYAGGKQITLDDNGIPIDPILRNKYMGESNTFYGLSKSDANGIYETYDPRTNTWGTIDNSKISKSTTTETKQNIYSINKVEISGVEDLDGIATEISKAADGMR